MEFQPFLLSYQAPFKVRLVGGITETAEVPQEGRNLGAWGGVSYL